jgi:predicted secreted protein
MLTEGVTPQVAGLVAPVGTVVTVQVRLTVPVNPFAGITVMVDVLPVVALASKVMGPLFVRAKLGVAAAVTVTEFVPIALL